MFAKDRNGSDHLHSLCSLPFNSLQTSATCRCCSNFMHTIRPFDLKWFKETKWILYTTLSDWVIEPFDAVSPFQASPQNCRTSGASNLSRNQTDVRWADSREQKSCKKKSPRCEMGRILGGRKSCKKYVSQVWDGRVGKDQFGPHQHLTFGDCWRQICQISWFEKTLSHHNNLPLTNQVSSILLQKQRLCCDNIYWAQPWKSKQ